MTNDRFMGEFKACLGAKCPSSCCLAETFRAPDGSDVVMHSWFRDQDEIDNIGGIQEIEKFGVEINQVKVLHDRRVYTAMAVNNCLCSHGCALPREKRPDVCNTFPFNISNSDNPIDQGCCAAKQIYYEAKDSGALTAILQLRKRLGFSDNKTWAKKLRSMMSNT